jgi:hypothetical protein
MITALARPRHTEAKNIEKEPTCHGQRVTPKNRFQSELTGCPKWLSIHKLRQLTKTTKSALRVDKKWKRYGGIVKWLFSCCWDAVEDWDGCSVCWRIHHHASFCLLAFEYLVRTDMYHAVHICGIVLSISPSAQTVPETDDRPYMYSIISQSWSSSLAHTVPTMTIIPQSYCLHHTLITPHSHCPHHIDNHPPVSVSTILISSLTQTAPSVLKSSLTNIVPIIWITSPHSHSPHYSTYMYW